MKKSKIYMLLDDVLTEYTNYYGENSETKLIEDLKHYFAELSKKSDIILMTNKETFTIANWLLKNDLYKYIDNIIKFMK